MEPTTHVIADEWRARADELARWAMESLVNRRDVWGQYVPVSQRKTSATGRMMNALTLPARDQRGGNDMVTLDKLARHFRAAQPGHVIGLHSSTADNTSRWFAIDVDLHEPDDDDAANIANLNFRAAVAWWKALQGRGLDPLLFDSNGAGGYHIWVLLDKPYPTDHVRAFAVDIVSDYESRGFKKRPEVFPKRAQPAGDKIGSWLRLPGRHHTRDHFSRVWSGDEWLDTPWLEGSAAIDAILAARRLPLPGFSEEAASVVPAEGGAQFRDVSPRAKPARTTSDGGARRPRVCVDLDGVLARYDGWRGPEHIGDPLPGAVEFVRELSEFAEVVVYTSRCTPSDEGEQRAADASAAIAQVTKWLEQHAFPCREVYAARGKPHAHAFIDDRAVPCHAQGATAGMERAVYARVVEEARRLCAARPRGNASVAHFEADLLDVMDAWKHLPPAVRAEIAKRARDALPR